MDLIASDQRGVIAKTREVWEEARGGISFIDKAYTLGMTWNAATIPGPTQPLMPSSPASIRASGRKLPSAPIPFGGQTPAGFQMEIPSKEREEQTVQNIQEAYGVCPLGRPHRSWPGGGRAAIHSAEGHAIFWEAHGGCRGEHHDQGGGQGEEHHGVVVED